MTKRNQNLIYLLMVLIIALVSIYDTLLSIIFQSTLLKMEENPIGRLLIAEGGVILLVEMKVIGTIIATIIGLRLVYTKYRHALIFVFCFQMWLAYYLIIGTKTYYPPFDYLHSQKFVFSAFVEFYKGQYYDEIAEGYRQDNSDEYKRYYIENRKYE